MRVHRLLLTSPLHCRPPSHVKDMHDAETTLAGMKFKAQFSEATPARGAGRGAMVVAPAPLYCTLLFGDTLEADMADLKRSTRLAAAWIQTNGVDNGIAVISYYGISRANSDQEKRRLNERYLTALWKHFAAGRSLSPYAWMPTATWTKVTCCRL